MKRINLDHLRLIMAICIVAIHTYPLVNFHVLLDYGITRVLFRVCVPVFFMITGYYCLSEGIDERKRLISYTKKISMLYLLSVLIYLPINIINGHLASLTLVGIVKELFITGTMYHLWYFPALLLGLWFLYFLFKRFPSKAIFPIVTFLYLLGLLGDSYYGLSLKMPPLSFFYQGVFKVFDYARNGLFYAPLFLYLGVVVRKRRCLLKKKTHLVSLLLSLLFLLLEGMFLLFLGFPKHNSMYVYLPLASYFLFTYFLQYGEGENRRIRKWALWIYILHPLSILLINKGGHLLNFPIEKYNLLNFFLVLILTFIFVFLLEWGFEKGKNVLMKKRTFTKSRERDIL